MSLALKLALSPLLVLQAVTTRRRALVLPEADGPREGRAGAADGDVLRLVIAGDSSAAGVGVSHQRQAVAGHLVERLHAALRQPIEWALHARSGLTTRQVFELLQAKPPRPADVVVVITGVNDVIDQVPVRRAIGQREALVDWLLGAALARHVVFAPLPPIDRFPVLPRPLRGVMGGDARRHDAALACWAARRQNVSHVPIDVELDGRSMAADGFHPGEPVYRACGEALATHIAECIWPRLRHERLQAA